MQAKMGRVRVRTTGLPMSLSEPPALEMGAEEKKPAKKRRTMSAGMEGARAQAISKSVARSMVTA